jgi:mono/diheme cytochrome c family protein
MHLAFAVLGVAFLAIFSWVLLQEFFAEWRTKQAEFLAIERQVKDPHALSLAARVGGIRQIWLRDVDLVDRCTTCHLGTDDPDFAAAAQPFTSHSGTWLTTHPPERFGCTICHGGQGEATSYRDAAHQPIPYWPQPMRPRELIEANCGVCHRERAPDGAFLLAEGRQTIAAAGCIACHDLPGFSLDEIQAPRLGSVGYKVRPDWLRNWLADPKSYLPRARMPNFRLQKEEIENLSTFLLAQRETPPLDASAVDWSKSDADHGRVLFGEARCLSCHTVNDRGGSLGPDLSRVGSKVGRDWLFSFIQDPMHDQPDTRMLRYRFSAIEIRDVVAYLTTDLVDPEAPATPPAVGYLDPKQVAAGRDTFLKHGCFSCHRFGDLTSTAKIGPSLMAIGDRVVERPEFGSTAVEPTLANWLYLKLRQPDALTEESRMPTFNFTESEAAAVVVALLSVRKADFPASRVTRAPSSTPYTPQGAFGALVSRYRCLSCHQVRGWGGTLSTVPLDRIGSQLQRSYLVSYLQNPSAVRVSIEERMPHFHMTAQEAETIADYVGAVLVDDSLERPLASDPDAARRGELLYRSLGCKGCHIIGASGGYVGPDLSDTGDRLKAGWIEHWLASPQMWKPGTLQPDYGLKPEAVRDLTAYLTTLTRTARGRNP